MTINELKYIPIVCMSLWRVTPCIAYTLESRKQTKVYISTVIQSGSRRNLVTCQNMRVGHPTSLETVCLQQRVHGQINNHDHSPGCLTATAQLLDTRGWFGSCFQPQRTYPTIPYWNGIRDDEYKQRMFPSQYQRSSVGNRRHESENYGNLLMTLTQRSHCIGIYCIKFGYNSDRSPDSYTRARWMIFV